jgi:serine/threonine protein phosphatase PrpC
MTQSSLPDHCIETDPAAASQPSSQAPASLPADSQPAVPEGGQVAESTATAIEAVLETTRRWFVQEEAVVGLAHRARNLPCQDAAQAVSHPRTALVLADGAGSSAVSEIGARAVVRATMRLLDTVDKPLLTWLDHDCPEPELEARQCALLLVKHAIGTLKDLAAEHRRELKDFRCTYLVAVLGAQRLFWLKVGDGAIVLETRRPLADEQGQLAWVHELSVLGEPGNGEFANQTQFLDSIRPEEVQIGCLPVEPVSGLALMSDGAAERLVANDGSRVAQRVSKLLLQLRQDKLPRTVLTRMFYEEGFCSGTSGDDRSIALAACADPDIKAVTPNSPLPAPSACPAPEAGPEIPVPLDSGMQNQPGKASPSNKEQSSTPSDKGKKPRRKRR